VNGLADGFDDGEGEHQVRRARRLLRGPLRVHMDGRRRPGAARDGRRHLCGEVVSKVAREARRDAELAGDEGDGGGELGVPRLARLQVARDRFDVLIDLDLVVALALRNGALVLRECMVCGRYGARRDERRERWRQLTFAVGHRVLRGPVGERWGT
jgi:hypothetical protein